MARLDSVIKTFVCAFVEHDTDKDGVLTQEEFKGMLDNCPNLKAKMPQCDLEQVMRCMDTNRDGVIDITEFCVRVGKILECGKQKKGECGECATAPLEQALKTFVTVFREYDTDNDEKLTKDEVKKMLEKEIDCPTLKAKLQQCEQEHARGQSQCNLDAADMCKVWECLSSLIKCAYEKKRDSCGECN